MSTTTLDPVVAGPIAGTLQKRWGWMLALGIVQIIGGLLALAVPAAASLVAVSFFAAILLVSAVVHVIHAFKVRRWSGFAMHLIGGLLYGAAGVLIFIDPFGGVAGLMLVLGVLFIVDGAVRTLLASTLRPRDGWGWFMAGGLVSIALGVLLLVQWPVGALWVVGTLFGIHMLFSGAMLTALAVRSRRARAADVDAPHPAPA